MMMAKKDIFGELVEKEQFQIILAVRSLRPPIFQTSDAKTRGTRTAQPNPAPLGCRATAAL
jgi:hypothetical protein